MSDILLTAAIKEKVYKLAHFILRFLDEESLDKAANSDELYLSLIHISEPTRPY